ncbi:hypothetical protein SAMN05421858_1677 [Haladaptatus litoreus]|uniref:Lipoprotein n=1 Tax=Haladaptatus litoreus TaxID=553468 RepID=A0A1N6YR99_9EURY|nr:hypothetical protein [Haladaptatus litoreus]SIR16969.1 hypothetical protein SAMN05421858_1677 [Haladaptatus litoreus]
MNRRTVLASVSSVLFAGCLTESSPGGSGTDEPDTSTPGMTKTTPGTTTTGSPDLQIPDENHCPPFGDDEKQVICYEYADSETNLLMTPSKEQAELPDDTVSFTLSNETGATFTTNYYHWMVWKLVDNEWFYIAPQVIPEPAMMLESSGSHTWSLTIDNTNLGSSIEGAQGTEDISLAGLGGGTYAFGISGWFQGQSYDESVGVATRFELVGNSLSLTPTDDLEEVNRDGDEKHVRVGQTDTTYLATRVENPDEEPMRKIPEQVIRITPIRNLLASFEDGVSRVRLDGRNTYLGETPQYIEYEGVAYRIETAGN